jgi:hypothetical protein
MSRQKKFLPLLLDTWLVSPIEKAGVVIPIEDVVKRRSKTILHIDNSLGKVQLNSRMWSRGGPRPSSTSITASVRSS